MPTPSLEEGETETGGDSIRFCQRRGQKVLCLSKNQAFESPDVTQSKAAGNRPDTTQSQAQVTDGNRPVGEASSTTDSQAQFTVGNRPVDVQRRTPSPSVSNDEFHQTECLDHSPVASHTRSQVKRRKKEAAALSQSAVDTSELAADYSTPTAVQSEPRDQLVLHLPSDFPSVTEHHADFVKCDTIDTANAVRDCMKQQWSNLVSPGCTVKVKVKDKLASAAVKNCYYISKVSFDSLYCYATAKAEVRLPDSRLIREL